VIAFDQPACNDLAIATHREWLVTNGIGGYASSTIAAMNTRRYHGLLIAATKPPLGRFVLLSQLEDALTVDGVRFDLSTNMYTGDVVHPQGFRNLIRFELEPHPTFIYAHDDWELRKSIFMLQGENTTVIEYVFTQKNEGHTASLEVRPLIAFRDYHGSTHENDALNHTLSQADGCIAISPYPGLPTLYLAHDPARIDTAAFWYRNFEYPAERARGLDHTEDLFSPFAFRLDIESGRHFSLIAATEPHSTSIVPNHTRAAELRSIDDQTPAPFGRPDLIPTLQRAAGQFIATRAPHKTLLAGYHWFGDWGRDTMISLPGLLLTTGHPEIAREILLQFVRYIDGGMLPNRFPDMGETPEYNTVDATLWFFEAIRQYVAFRDDTDWRDHALALLRESLYTPLKEIILAHIAGTRYGIHADEQGFLWAGDATTQLTWMDARVGDIPITPRAGRPVEIQALWFNALRTLEGFAHLLADDATAHTCNAIADKLKSNFEAVFWNEQLGYLNDVAGDGGDDASLRPNQVFAISLHHPLLTGERAHRVIAAVERDLLTPVGLRTLSPHDAHYCRACDGDASSRDGAYHQGTVWPWLIGAFFEAKLRVAASRESVIAEIDAWLDVFTAHLREAGLGQVSEIFDADHPHTPRGCIAQAWSVAEVLRLAMMVESPRHGAP
jgi:predicted glycogen debranching enzyme